MDAEFVKFGGKIEDLTDVKFIAGDRVRVSSNCATYNCTGIVLYHIVGCYVKVQLDDGSIHNYKAMSLECIGHTDINNINNTKENHEMAVKGNYRVAMVKFTQGYNSEKEYAFALFDEEIQIGDCVLCDTANGHNVAKVVDVLSQKDYSGCTVTKEIICKVDYSAYEERKEKRKKKENLKKQMDKMVVDNQELILYQAIADKNPVMAELLAQYKALEEV